MDTAKLVFHHIGIACRDIEKTKPFYAAMGYTAAATVDDPVQQVRVCFLDKDGAPRVELLEPLNEKTSPVSRILASAGVSPYHICYQVENLEAAIRSMRAQRFLLVSGPVPACAMDNRRIAFLFQKHTGLVELVEQAR